MKRVVVTGMGVISPLGNDVATVTQSLRNMTSGIVRNEEFEEFGMKSRVGGLVQGFDSTGQIDRKDFRFMPETAEFCYIAMRQAIEQAGLSEAQISNPRSGLVVGSGGPSSRDIVEAADIARSRGIKRMGPYRVTKGMSSMPSACLATPYKIKGVNYSITSACSTSAHCIGNAMELIQLGKQDIVFAGGGEKSSWTSAGMFDAMGALSSMYNDTPGTASRPYDKNRDGFVMGEGAAILVIEALDHAQARGANIIAELVGYAATSDGDDMVAPSGEGAVRSMQIALETCNDLPIDYINAHGTSTPAGDITELKAVREVFGDDAPPVSSSKSLMGHLMGGAGAAEALCSLIMLSEGFISGSANIEEMDPEAEFVITETREAELAQVMSNSFGFGGTNATLVFRAYRG